MTQLREFIKTHGLLQRRIADMASVGDNRMSDYCRGLIPPVDVQARIAAALRECTGKDVTVEQLWPVTTESTK